MIKAMKRITMLAAAVAALLSALSSCGTGEPQPSAEQMLIDSLMRELTLEEKISLLVGENTGRVKGSAGMTRPVERLGIPAIVMADGPAGLRISPTRKDDDNTYYCTQFPVGTLLAATWDVKQVEKATAAIGNEVLEYGVDVLLAPGMNIHRNPLCGRNFEYFSEDPVLSGRTAAAYVRGVQSNGVGTSVKHFAVNNNETNRCASDSRVSLRALREIYLRNFEIAVRESHPWTVMSSYNRLNGRYTAERTDLLVDVLRNDWGYAGTVITDWGDCPDPVEQIAGGNASLQSGKKWQYDSLLVSCRSGRLDEAVVDARVREMLALIVKTPTFRHYEPSNNPDLAAHAAVSRETAADGMVLLKNEDAALPLAAGCKVAMFGTNSYRLGAGGAGSGDVNCERVVNLDEGLVAAGFTLDTALDEVYRGHMVADSARVAAANAGRSWFYIKENYSELPADVVVDAAAAAAESADVAIVTIRRDSGEGYDRQVDEDFNLKKSEFQTVKAVCEAFHACGKKVAVVLNVCGAMETASWRDLPDAILVAWLPGQEAGHAVCDVLSGKVSPSGCLPMTFPLAYSSVPAQNFPILPEVTHKNDSHLRYKRAEMLHEIKDIDYVDYDEDLKVGYRGFEAEGVSYPFGFGLSYADFEISDFEVKKSAGEYVAYVKVTNKGEVAGRKVVQLYVGGIAEDEPYLQLKAFAKSPLLAPGESRTVTLSFPEEYLAVFDPQASEWVLREGEYDFVIADGVASPLMSVPVTVKSGKRLAVSDVLGWDGDLYIGTTKTTTE